MTALFRSLPISQRARGAADAERILGLEAGRGVAALLVAFAHANMFAGFVGPAPFLGFFGFGTSGVDFFFVLSGFVICNAHRSDFGRPDRIRRYAWRRLVRVFPPYWAMTGLTIVAALAVAGLAPEPWSVGYLIRTFVLAPMKEYPIIPPAWSLQYEAMFYVLFSALLLSIRFGACVFGLWILIIVLGQIFGFPFPISFVTDIMNGEFLLGVSIALLGLRAGPKTLIAGLILLLLCAIAQTQLTGMFHDVIAHTSGRRVIYGLTSAIILLGLIGTPLSSDLSIWMGRLSYPLYLVHYPIMTLLWLEGWRPGGAVQLLGYVAVALMLAAMFHVWIEAPILLWLHRRKAPWLRTT